MNSGCHEWILQQGRQVERKAGETWVSLPASISVVEKSALSMARGEGSMSGHRANEKDGVLLYYGERVMSTGVLK